MLYLDLIVYLQTLSTETKIIIMQISLLIAELLYFLYLRKFFKEEEARIYKQYRK